MPVTLSLLLQCVIKEPRFTVARWAGGFSLTRGLGASALFADYELGEDWISVSAPLLGSAALTSGLRLRCLARNATSGVARFAFTDGTIALHTDYPTYAFDRDEFRFVDSLFWKELRAAAKALGVRVQPLRA